jgi:putative ABC transport system substrate-binding protein
MSKKITPISLGLDPAIEIRAGWSRREFLRAATLAGTAGFLGFGSEAAQAQQAAKVPRIGFLASGSPKAYSSRIEAFRQGLRQLGYVEGKTIAIEYRYAEGLAASLPDLVADLVRLNVDVIVTSSTPATLALKNGTKTIPIVFVSVGDPVGSGLVASLARPGGNVTGLSNQLSDLVGKHLELLKEVVPKISRVAVLGSTASPNRTDSQNALEVVARSLGVQLQLVEIGEPKELDGAFSQMTKARAGAILIRGGALLSDQRIRIAELAARSRLPAIHWDRLFAEAGGLMSYGPSSADMFRRAATYVDKILKGRTPADLPVEQPMKFEFIVNLITAKQIGLTFPPNVLVRANEVIR